MEVIKTMKNPVTKTELTYNIGELSKDFIVIDPV